MRIVGMGQTVQVVVDDDALVVATPVVVAELKAQLEAERPAFEFLAAEKFDHGGPPTGLSLFPRATFSVS